MESTSRNSMASRLPRCGRLSQPAPGSRGGPLSAFNKIRIGRIHIVYDIFTWVPQRFSDAREGLYPEIEHLASPSPRTII